MQQVRSGGSFAPGSLASVVQGSYGTYVKL